MCGELCVFLVSSKCPQVHRCLVNTLAVLGNACYLQTAFLLRQKKTLHLLCVHQEIPQQLNGSDCGVFICKYADYISRDKPMTFTQVSKGHKRFLISCTNRRAGEVAHLLIVSGAGAEALYLSPFWGCSVGAGTSKLPQQGGGSCAPSLPLVSASQPN